MERAMLGWLLGKTGVGLLTRLRRDKRANTLAIMAAALVPLCGVIGGGLDVSRMYIIKTRLQHACDAGALAGRKAMGGGTWSHSGGLPQKQADQFFDANIGPAAFGAKNVTGTFAEASGKVTGTATADVPMTLMRVLGKTTEHLSVTCDAEMRLPNTDIMFVLDTTGSMAETVPGDSSTKIDALKRSVKCFYEIVARLDTNAACDGAAPSGGTGDQVQIRFGFVPYSTNVRVGRLLPPEFIANNWSYQSRLPITRPQSEWTPAGSEVEVTDAKVRSSEGDCTQTNAERLDSTTTTTNGNRRTITEVRHTRQGWSNNECYGKRTTTKKYEEYRTTQVFDRWRYALVSHDLSSLKGASGFNASVDLPIGANGAMVPVTWDGCIEERTTARTTDYSPIPAGAKDLQLDLVPNPADPETLWGPALPNAIFMRRQVGGGQTPTGSWNRSEVLDAANYRQGASAFCPQEARKLKSYSLASDFEGYVDSLYPTGNTYHDIGLLWGARLVWPTGMLQKENEFTDRGGEIDRHIIFMTDGDTVTQNYDYAAYGLPWFDRRQTPESDVPSQGMLNEQVNLRFSALCTAVKNNPKGITLWVINFGSGTNSTTRNRLRNCATSADYFFDAGNAAELQAAFRRIADDISQLRLTR